MIHTAQTTSGQLPCCLEELFVVAAKCSNVSSALRLDAAVCGARTDCVYGTPMYAGEANISAA